VRADISVLVPLEKLRDALEMVRPRPLLQLTSTANSATVLHQLIQSPLVVKDTPPPVVKAPAPEEPEAPQTRRYRVLKVLADGRPRRVSEIAQETAQSHHRGMLGWARTETSSVGSVLGQLLAEKLVVKLERGLYRLDDQAASALRSKPEPKRPPQAQPPANPARRGRRSDEFDDLETLRGAAPAAVCPQCRVKRAVRQGLKYHPAIGVRHGRYVYECRECGSRYYNTPE
jgi:hypothetical protein